MGKTSKELKEIESLQEEIREDVKNIKEGRHSGKIPMMVNYLGTAVEALNMELNLIVDALKKKGVLK